MLLEKYQTSRKLGLVWERDELEPDSSFNTDFVALELLPEHSVGIAPYQNFGSVLSLTDSHFSF
jgi:adenine-specific DNA-methyltransferase